MADQGIWFKLHCSALDDPDLDNLPVADFGRWAKLGTYTKQHGTKGELRLSPPCRALCAMFQVLDFEALISVIKMLPHVRVDHDARGDRQTGVSNETSESVSFMVSFDNWWKYQGDFSTPRVGKFRAKQAEMKRSKRRGEEKRKEEKKTPSLSPPHMDSKSLKPETQDPDWKLGPTVLSALAPTRFRALASERVWWQTMARTHPAVHFAREITKAEAWCVSTPAKAPRREYKRFLNHWFGNAQADAEQT